MNTLVVSPDNRSRIEINESIHVELRDEALSALKSTTSEHLCRAKISLEPTAHG